MCAQRRFTAPSLNCWRRRGIQPAVVVPRIRRAARGDDARKTGRDESAQIRHGPHARSPTPRQDTSAVLQMVASNARSSLSRQPTARRHHPLEQSTFLRNLPGAGIERPAQRACAHKFNSGDQGRSVVRGPGAPTGCIQRLAHGARARTKHLGHEMLSRNERLVPRRVVLAHARRQAANRRVVVRVEEKRDAPPPARGRNDSMQASETQYNKNTKKSAQEE